MRLTRSTPKDPFGAIRWTKWLNRRGLGSGANWRNNGIPDDADDTLHPYTMVVLAFRPRRNVFTRMRVVYIKPWRCCADNTSTLHYKGRYFHGDQSGPGYWQWLRAY